MFSPLLSMGFRVSCTACAIIRFEGIAFAVTVVLCRWRALQSAGYNHLVL